MKRSILLLMSFWIVGTLCAQYTSGNLFVYGGTISGPVKKVSITLKQHRDPSDTLTSVAFFDTKGNIMKTGYYKGEKLIIDGIYRYSDNNSCIHYQYDENGVEDTHYSKIFFDDKGQELTKFFFWKDNLTRVDSMVYDVQGRLIAKYVSEYMKRTPLLQVEYSYDSIGRILGENNIKTGERYTISYMPNGNYKKQISKNGQTYVENYIVNKDGQLIECRSADKIEKYSKYDKYGNWLKRESSLDTHTSNGRIGSTTERTIEYY
jgi:hypothetical protein